MSAKQRIRGPMRERLLSFLQAANHFIRHPRQFDDPYGCAVGMAMYLVAAISLLAVLYMGGKIAYDFTLTPAERDAADAAASSTDGDMAADSDIDPALPGEPYLDGRHYAITGTGDAGTNRVYTIELLGEGDTGDLRVWEDETGRGTFTITDGSIRIEMERMVPAEDHAGWEPNVFEGAISADGSRIDGTWTRRDWSAFEGKLELGDWVDYGFYGERL